MADPIDQALALLVLLLTFLASAVTVWALALSRRPNSLVLETTQRSRYGFLASAMVLSSGVSVWFAFGIGTEAVFGHMFGNTALLGLFVPAAFLGHLLIVMSYPLIVVFIYTRPAMYAYHDKKSGYILTRELRHMRHEFRMDRWFIIDKL